MILWQILPLNVMFIYLLSSLSLTSSCRLDKSFFVMDSFGVTLSMMPMFMLFSLVSMLLMENKTLKLLLMMTSCMSSVLCFMSKNLLIFFMSYELSMMSLLFTLFINSPYSERSLAGWYFLGYLVFGGVPLLLLCMYMSLKYEKMSHYKLSKTSLYLMFMIFMTKVPLFPFHSWLPMVHAEAKSFISMMLSGYMMKLGLLGVVRFFSLSSESLKVYLLMFFSVGCMFFLSCLCELDNKRWLAFLSLGHICMGMGGVFSLKILSDNVLSTFSVGHGLSVFMLFLYFYCYSLKSGSRKWVMKMMHNKKISNLLLSMSILSLVAFPPSILFFKEVMVYVSMSGAKSLIVMFSAYVLLSVFGPMSTISVLVSRFKNNTMYSLSSSSLVMMSSSIMIFFMSSLLL